MYMCIDGALCYSFSSFVYDDFSHVTVSTSFSVRICASKVDGFY